MFVHLDPHTPKNKKPWKMREKHTKNNRQTLEIQLVNFPFIISMIFNFQFSFQEKNIGKTLQF